MTGQILSISQSQPNMSYTLEFIGPALSCDHADAGLIREVNSSYARLSENISLITMYYYAAWVPKAGFDRTDLSFIRNGTDIILDRTSSDAAHLYIIPNTSAAAFFGAGSSLEHGSDDIHYGYRDLLDCKLYNASYQVFFNFTFPSQSIDVRSRELLNPVNGSNWAGLTPGREEQRICYQAVMESLGDMIVGYEGFETAQMLSSSGSKWDLMPIDWTNREKTRKGLEEVFQNMTLSLLATPSLT